MTQAEKIEWMIQWAHRNQCVLTLEGECGFGRECVGVVAGGSFPSYEWYDEDYNREDNNGEVWCPPGAYHKHPCVAVLGRGSYAEGQLYDWLNWFDTNGFKLEVDPRNLGGLSPLEVLFVGTEVSRMVRINPEGRLPA